MVEHTLSIIKPDAVKKNIIGEIIRRLEARGLKVIGSKMIHLSREQAEAFYAEHKGREFYEPLIDFMTESPSIVQVLQGENAIALNREIMGVTDPTQAAAGTIRADFAESTRLNCVHGSDSPESAKREIAFFFNSSEIFG